MLNVNIFNTGETVTNEFYLVNLPDELTHNSQSKFNKIEFTKSAILGLSSPYMPAYLRRLLPRTFNIEYELEKYRDEHYPDYPSRFACLFAFKDLDTAIATREREGWVGDIYKITITSPDYKITKHNMEYISVMWCLAGLPDILFKENLLDRYLRGEASNFDYAPYIPKNGIISPTMEYLIEGTFTVERVL